MPPAEHLSSSKEEKLLIFEFHASRPHRRQQPRQPHCRRALYIIVETRSVVPVLFQELEGIVVGEILELNEEVRPPRLHRIDKLLHLIIKNRPEYQENLPWI